MARPSLRHCVPVTYRRAVSRNAFTYESRYPSQDHKVVTSKTPEECAAICESEKSIPCRSFDYERSTKKCYLSKAVAGAGDLIPAKGFDFYQTECLDALGMEAKAIPDSSITATSSLDGISGPKEARLHNPRVSGVSGLSNSRGGWSPSVNNNNQYLQIDLGSTFRITGIATQGVESTSEWVTSYKIEYSSDKTSWHFYQNTLSGNKDDSTVVRQQVQVFVARYVRIR
ncbi:Coagulation factor VIII, partial [Exaiptasia diaphana]